MSLGFPTITEAEFSSESVDPVWWLNTRLEGVPPNKFESYLNQLALSLNLFSQEISDRNELLGARYLNSIASLQKDITGISSDVSETLTRFKQLQHEQLRLAKELEVKDPSGHLEEIAHAREKIEYIKAALTRRSQRSSLN